jgi:hypothetical protein
MRSATLLSSRSPRHSALPIRVASLSRPTNQRQTRSSIVAMP